MAKISIKKDFKDGDKLPAQQLNLNFEVIEKGVNDLNNIQWENEPVVVREFRGTTEEIANQPIIDGQRLTNIETGETYLDKGLERISTGSGNVVEVGNETPVNDATKLWINPDGMIKSLGTEVVNSLEGNETTMAPSVAAVNKALATIIESGTINNIDYVKYSDGTLVQRFIQDVTASQDRSAGGLTYYSGNVSVTLPISFINLNYEISTNVNMANMNYFAQSYGSPESVNKINVSFVSTGKNETRNIHVIAIGKWK